MKSKTKLTFSFQSKDEKDKWTALFERTLGVIAPPTETRAARTARGLTSCLSESSLVLAATSSPSDAVVSQSISTSIDGIPSAAASLPIVPPRPDRPPRRQSTAGETLQ
jgi:hypothetical protein